MKCLECGADKVRRSHRKGLWEKLILPLVGRRPFRCQHCETRFIGHASSRSGAVKHRPGGDAWDLPAKWRKLSIRLRASLLAASIFIGMLAVTTGVMFHLYT